MRQERRLRRYHIHDRVMHQMFNKTRGAFNTHFEVPVDFVEMPEDAEIKNALYDPYRHAMQVTVYHPSFDVVADGCEIPVHMDSVSLDLRCVTIEQSDREKLLSECLAHFQEKYESFQKEVNRLSLIVSKMYEAVGYDDLMHKIRVKEEMIIDLGRTIEALSNKETDE